MTELFASNLSLKNIQSFQAIHLSSNPESPPTRSTKDCQINSSHIRSSNKIWTELEIDTYGDYLDLQTEGFYSEKGIVTDRFIPARKHLKL
jgi:hypothetical protein